MYTKISCIHTINCYMFRPNICNLQRHKVQKLDSLNDQMKLYIYQKHSIGIKVKVKQSRNKLGVAQMVPGS